MKGIGKRYWLQVFLTLTCTFLLSACGNVGNIIPADGSVKVKVKSVPLKIALAAGGAVLQVAAEEFLGVEIDAKDLLGQIIEVEDATKGTPPEKIPVIMVINKKTNDILYWQLTENVKTVRLRHDAPGSIELKVINDSPLKIELWMDGDMQEIKVEVELKE